MTWVSGGKSEKLCDWEVWERLGCREAMVVHGWSSFGHVG